MTLSMSSLRRGLSTLPSSTTSSPGTVDVDSRFEAVAAVMFVSEIRQTVELIAKKNYTELGRLGAAQHRGSVRASHPAALGLILGVPRYSLRVNP